MRPLKVPFPKFTDGGGKPEVWKHPANRFEPDRPNVLHPTVREHAGHIKTLESLRGHLSLGWFAIPK